MFTSYPGVGLSTVRTWLAAITEPMTMPDTMHAYIKEHPDDSTDTIVNHFVPTESDPSELERRIEIWRQYCLDWSVGDCDTSGQFDSRAVVQYFADYLMEIQLRKCIAAEILPLGIHTPFLDEADVIITYIERELPTLRFETPNALDRRVDQDDDH